MGKDNKFFGQFGGGGGGGSPSIDLETNDVVNNDQSKLNLKGGTGIKLTENDGNVLIDSVDGLVFFDCQQVYGEDSPIVISNTNGKFICYESILPFNTITGGAMGCIIEVTSRFIQSGCNQSVNIYIGVSNGTGFGTGLASSIIKSDTSNSSAINRTFLTGGNKNNFSLSCFSNNADSTPTDYPLQSNNIINQSIINTGLSPLNNAYLNFCVEIVDSPYDPDSYAVLEFCIVKIYKTTKL